MSMPVRLKDEPNWVLYQPPLGRPNPQDPQGEKIPRESANNGYNFYEAFEVLLIRTTQRTCDLFSSLREKIEREDYPQGIIGDTFCTISSSVEEDLKKAATPGDVYHRILAMQDQIPGLDIPKFNGFLIEFSNSEKTSLIEFMKDKFIQERSATYEAFFQEHEVSFEQFFTPKGVAYFNKQHPLFKLAYLGKCFFAKECDLKKSSWNPTKSITLLFEEVKESKVLLFNATLGEDFYSARAVQRLTLPGGQKILGWDKGTRFRREKIEAMRLSHNIGVVGVRISNESSGQVFFVDPKESSDPNNPSAQKYYVVSYDTFRRAVGTQQGLHNEDSENYEQWYQSHLARSDDELFYAYRSNFSDEEM